MKTSNLLLATGAVIAVLSVFSAPTSYAADNADDIVIGNQDKSLTANDMDVNRGAAGGDDILSLQTLEANSSGNSVNVGGDMTTGTIAIADNFGKAGLGSYVLNTGNNATINSAVSVNVQFSPGP